MTQDTYHEKQRLMRCALHTLNNLFQEQAFTKEDLDEYSHTLTPGSWINPHKNLLGLGNYDINVMMVALRTKGYTIKWWDRRKDLANIPYDNVYGLIINYVSMKFFGFWESRHWFSMRTLPVNGSPMWYSFDSKLSSPYQFDSTQKVIEYLRDIVQSKQGEVLMVVKEDEPAQEPTPQTS